MTVNEIMCVHAVSLSLHGFRRYKLYCLYRQPCEHFLYYSINQYHVKVIFSDLSCTRVMKKIFKLFAQTGLRRSWALVVHKDLMHDWWVEPLSFKGVKPSRSKTLLMFKVFPVCFFLSTACSVILSLCQSRWEDRHSQSK